MQAAPRSLSLVFVLVGLVLAAGCVWLCDDAYISFRYAKNLAEGGGLAFNVGASPPIEGYSNLAWVVVLAAFERLGVIAPQVAPVLSLGALGWLLLTIRRDVFTGAVGIVGAPPPALALLVFVTLPPLVVWGTSGLETMAFALAVHQVQRHLLGWAGRAWLLVPWAILAVTLRVDGQALVAGLLVAGAVFAALPSRAVRPRSALVLLVGLAVGVGLALLVRHGVHGTLVPHTVRVKVEPSGVVFERGLRYLGALAVAAPAVAVLFGWAAGRVVRRLPRMARDEGAATCALLGVVPLACLAQSIVVGGDFMAFGRFLVPALPGVFCIVCLARSADEAARSENGTGRSATETGRAAEPRQPWPWRPVGALLLVLTSGLALSDRLPVPRAVLDQVHFRWNTDEPVTEGQAWRRMQERLAGEIRLGKALAQHTEPGESLVAGMIGGLGYYSGLHLFDTYGLVDAEVGLLPGDPANHSPGHDKQVEPAYFLDQRPTYFWGTALVSGAAPLEGLPPGALDDPALRDLFELEFIDLAEPGGPQLRLVRLRAAP